MSTEEGSPRSNLVDLLLLITLLGLIVMLVALWLPRSRRPAIRSICSNNMTQLALATMNFETAKGHFPGYQQTIGGGRDVTWLITLMPYMERDDYYAIWNDPAIPTKNIPVDFIGLFACPSDSSVKRNLPFNSYVANAGMAGWKNEKPANGAFHDLINSDVVTTIGDMHDGTSYTILISENLQAGQWREIGKEATVFVWHPTTTPKPVHLINGEKKTARLSADSARPSSAHRGGVNAAFADKSTRFLSETIDYKVYMQLMTPDGANSDMPAELKTYKLRKIDYEN